jgi:hypothetical protein
MEIEEEELVPNRQFHLISLPRHPHLISKSEEEETCQRRDQVTMPIASCGEVPRIMDILCKHQDALSIDKYDLELAKDFKHKICLKTQDPVDRKQFKMLEPHLQFIKQAMDE